MAQRAMSGTGGLRTARFARTKFQPPPVPATRVERPALEARLTAGNDKCLTLVVGSAGAGKSVLLSGWARARSRADTGWLSCDEADANPLRFWSGFIEAIQLTEPGFGGEATELLVIDRVMSADVIASLANDAAKLPEGSAIIVDDFHHAARAVSREMTDLVERWPAQTAQLILSSRFDPPLRLHKRRLSGDLCEIRGSDLYFSLPESGTLLAHFGIDLPAADLELLHQRSEGWPAAMQMAALSLRGNSDPQQLARTLNFRSHAIAEYFISEVLDQQPAELVQFMLDTSVLDELTPGACEVVTGRHDAAALLRTMAAGNLFVIALDELPPVYRYHQLVREVLGAELDARDGARGQVLHLRAAEWLEAHGDPRRAARHFLKARQVDRALALLQDKVVTGFLHDPALPAPLDLDAVDASLLRQAPDRLLALAIELLLSGDVARGGEYLDLLERASPTIPPGSALAARHAIARALHHVGAGQADRAVQEARAAREIQQRIDVSDEWTAAVAMIFIRAYTLLEDFHAVEREAAEVLAVHTLSEPVRQVVAPGALALACFEAGHLGQAAEAAQSAEASAVRLGFDKHYFAVDYLRVQAGLALERANLDTAEHLVEQALTISERGRPFYEFLTLLDRAQIWAARGHVREALETVEAARHLLPWPLAVLVRADELESAMRLSLGDLPASLELANRLPKARRELMLARIALASNDRDGANEHLQERDRLTPRLTLVREILLAAAAIKGNDPTTVSAMANVLETARHGGFLATVVGTAPDVTSYLVEHSEQLRTDPLTAHLITAAIDARSRRPHLRPESMVAERLTPAEMRVLKLLPTSSYPQMAVALYISLNTVKSHLRSIYQKLGAASRSEAIERAVDLRLL